MAKTVPLDGPTRAWARDRFGEYYRTAKVPVPDRLNRREFAAFPFATETLMRRHATLRTPAEFHAFLKGEVPRHVYYSSAYYRWPAEPTMSAKEWLGADLIFDLDSDHLRGAASLGYADQLALVKRRLVQLVDDFLFGDFGVDPAATSLVFSGGRGYHVHVRQDGFTSLSSPERRELVDYVIGTGVEPMRAVTTRRATGGSEVPPEDEISAGRRGRSAGSSARYLASPDSPGWTGRSSRAVLEVLARWESAGTKAAAEELKSYGVPAARAKSWAETLVEKGGARKIRSNLTLEVFAKDVPQQFLDALVPRAAVELQGETDAPVTTDVHRLIRLPGSLHGGTGLRVVPLTREGLEGFDPLRDAWNAPLDGAQTRIRVREEYSYPFPDDAGRGRPGETLDLPTPVALFLVLRGEAELPPSPA